jgi:hypothetical protein
MQYLSKIMEISCKVIIPFLVGSFLVGCIGGVAYLWMHSYAFIYITLGLVCGFLIWMLGTVILSTLGFKI